MPHLLQQRDFRGPTADFAVQVHGVDEVHPLHLLEVVDGSEDDLGALSAAQCVLLEVLRMRDLQDPLPLYSYMIKV